MILNYEKTIKLSNGDDLILSEGTELILRNRIFESGRIGTDTVTGIIKRIYRDESSVKVDIKFCITGFALYGDDDTKTWNLKSLNPKWKRIDLKHDS